MNALPTIGFSTNVFDNPPNMLANVENICRHFKLIELEVEGEAKAGVLQAQSYDPLVKGLQRLKEERGLRYSVHAPYVGPQTNFCTRDEQLLKLARGNLRRAIELCADVGGERVTYHPGYRYGLSNAELKNNLKRAIADQVVFADRLGIRLCLENMGADRPAFVVFDEEEQLEICRDTGTSLTMDIIHLSSLIDMGPAYDAVLRRMVKHLDNLHIADMVVPRHVHIPFGLGDLPIRDILGKLRAYGYRGNAIVEESDGEHSGEEFLRRAAAFFTEEERAYA
ncbi:sugar phosphate isomerase/epimerase family protein [Sorangium sp. So ce1128]